MSVTTARPVVLVIMDGIGLGSGLPDDAVASATTPNLDWLLSECPHTTLKAHGISVGLPSDDDMGNSEVGHNAMGAGKVYAQGAALVNQALGGDALFEGEPWSKLIAGKTLHLIGLVSDGNVHSHVKHLHTLIEYAMRDGVTSLRVHALTDGRDVEPRSALRWIKPLEEKLLTISQKGFDYRIASGGGRMVMTMDRYQSDWSMVERGWHAHVLGNGNKATSASAEIQRQYAAHPHLSDQTLAPFVITDDEGEPVGRINDGDSVLLINFRGDRAIEISQAFDDAEFDHFDRIRHPNIYYAGMMLYDGDAAIPKHYLVSPPTFSDTVGEHLAMNGVRTTAIAETHKFGHVTYFFNGNRSAPFDAELEEYIEVASDDGPLEEHPQMKAVEVTDLMVKTIAAGKSQHIRVNYANGDMVGHTGNLEATRISVETVDLCLGRLIEATRDANGILLVTADHGNADQMWTRKSGKVLKDPNGNPTPRTSHTLNPVPFAVYDPTGQTKIADVQDASIASIGATLLHLLGVTPPASYLPSLVD